VSVLLSARFHAMCQSVYGAVNVDVLPCFIQTEWYSRGDLLGVGR
jgi:hypothetical protein